MASKTLDIIGYHLGTRVDIQTLKSQLKLTLVYHDLTELVYELGKNSYLLIHDYGSLVFLGATKKKQEAWLKKVRSASGVGASDLDPEYYLVELNARAKYQVLFDKIVLKKMNHEIARVLMLSIAQSIALDHYTAQSEQLLKEISIHTTELEKRGAFSIRGRNLAKYMGRTMNLKNKIVGNLYVFDTPTEIWNDELLDRIHTDLHRELDIDQRYRSLKDNLETIKESLDFFNEFNQHTHSSRLEWIIILLILFEIVKPFFDQWMAG